MKASVSNIEYKGLYQNWKLTIPDKRDEDRDGWKVDKALNEVVSSEDNEGLIAGSVTVDRVEVGEDVPV